MIFKLRYAYSIVFSILRIDVRNQPHFAVIVLYFQTLGSLFYYTPINFIPYNVTHCLLEIIAGAKMQCQQCKLYKNIYSSVNKVY